MLISLAFRRLLSLGIFCLLLVAGSPLVAQGQAPQVTKKQPGMGYHPGDIALELTLRDQHDNPVALSDFRGKNVLLLFSAAWCGPCMIAAEASEEFIRKLNEKGQPTVLVEVLAQNLYGDPAERIDAIDWAEQFNLTTAVLHPGGDYDAPALQQLSEYARRYGSAFPTAVLLSPHGRIINAYTGFNPAKIESDFLDMRAYNERTGVDWVLTGVERMELGSDLKTTLTAPLYAALAALDRRDANAACQQFACFTEQVRLHSGRGVSAEGAHGLLEAMQVIQEKLACE